MFSRHNEVIFSSSRENELRLCHHHEIRMGDKQKHMKTFYLKLSSVTFQTKTLKRNKLMLSGVSGSEDPEHSVQLFINAPVTKP